jgi:hypothetical protein
MDDAAARERRKAAVLAAVANVEAPPSPAARPAAANEPRWNSRRVWWQGTAAVFVVALSTVVVLRIGEQDSRTPDAQEPALASKPAPETTAPPPPIATPDADAAPASRPDFDRSAARSRSETGAQPTAAAAAKPGEPSSPATLGESVGPEVRRAPAPVVAPSAFPGAAAPSGKLEVTPDAAVDALAKANKSASTERAQGAAASVAPEAMSGGQRRSEADVGRARLSTTPAPQPPQDSARSSTGALQGANRDARMQSAQEFISAVEAGDIAAVQRLLDSGQPVDARDQDGRTALTRAVLRSDAKMVGVLVARGANPRAADKSGRTPLDYASEANASAVLDALGRK